MRHKAHAKEIFILITLIIGNSSKHDTLLLRHVLARAIKKQSYMTLCNRQCLQKQGQRSLLELQLQHMLRGHLVMYARWTLNVQGQYIIGAINVLRL